MKTAYTQAGKEYVVGQITVRFKDGTREPDAKAFLVTRGHAILDLVPKLRLYLVAVPEGQEEALCAQYKTDPLVMSADLVALFRTAGS